MNKDEIISTATINNWSRLNVSESTIEERLTKRANKRLSTKNIIPTEYFINKKNIQILTQIIDCIQDKQYNIQTAIYNLAVILLKQHNLLSIKNSKIESNNPYLTEILHTDFDNIKLQKDLLKFKLPSDEKDFLGIVYQSLLQEGCKNKQGSYYTPERIIKSITKNIHPDMKYLDPCCGTGSFLLKVSEKLNSPQNIVGCDIDKTACFIAKINLIIKFKNIIFKPQIYNIDILTDNSVLQDEQFDIIATNPPWGSMTNSEYKKFYPEIRSGESYSYFLIKSQKLLKQNGICIFILPESILNVKTHKDIRKFILKNFEIIQIKNLGKIFTGVLSDVILLNLKKSNDSEGKNTISIIKNKNKCEIQQSAYLSNKNFNFSILSDFDVELLKKIYSIPHYTLQNSQWGLGIVTGNNKKHLSEQFDNTKEKIYTGKEVAKYSLKDSNKFINYNRELFQQTAPDNIYRAKEKLIYKFISKNLVFAYDKNQSLVLNSANILIPDVYSHSIKSVLAFLNSEIFQYIYCKEFNELKVLKGNLMQLPFPKLLPETKILLEELINSILINKNSDAITKIDDLIYQTFNLTEEEKLYIKNSI